MQALQDLEAGRINVVFFVDLFNEGVDVPPVDTLLLLRPTESATLFLQQLGRGLRKHRAKSACTVLDFVGQHRKEFRFDQRFRALLGGSRADVIEQIKKGFPFLPAGCHMQLDRVASEIVIESIKRAIPSRWVAKVEELRSMRRNVSDVTLASISTIQAWISKTFMKATTRWSELREAAGLPVAVAGPENDRLRRACGRMLHIDDLSRIDTLSAVSRAPVRRTLAVCRRTTSGYSACWWLRSPTQLLRRTQPKGRNTPSLVTSSDHRRAPRNSRGASSAESNHVHHLIGEQTEVPLRVHGRYTRTEILSGFGVGNAARASRVARGRALRP